MIKKNVKWATLLFRLRFWLVRLISPDMATIVHEKLREYAEDQVFGMIHVSSPNWDPDEVLQGEIRESLYNRMDKTWLAAKRISDNVSMTMLDAPQAERIYRAYMRGPHATAD